jgi:hypothetical protein
LRERTTILLWIGLSFVLIAINNLLVFTDVIIWPTIDLLPLRRLSSVAAAAVLVVGLAWEAE